MHYSYQTIFVVLEIISLVSSKMNHDSSMLAVQGEGEATEPSCEELRSMWRHTKREMQQKSEIASPRFRGGRYQEPFAYGWKTPARPRNAMYSKPVYGRVVHSPEKFLYRNNLPNRLRSFDEVARMVGSSGNYYGPTITTQQKPVYFRLDYPMRRPSPPSRVSHKGRFQELQSALRTELQMRKLKNDEADSPSSSLSADDSASRFEAYRSPQSSEDDVTADNSKGRKLRGTEENSQSDTESYLEKVGGDEKDKLQSTSKPVSLDEDSIPRRWALGEWRR